jgi:hypothetical protein
MSQGAWEFLTSHKFGSNGKSEKQEYINELKATMNAKNLSKCKFLKIDLMSSKKRTGYSILLNLGFQKLMLELTFKILQFFE